MFYAKLRLPKASVTKEVYSLLPKANWIKCNIDSDAIDSQRVDASGGIFHDNSMMNLSFNCERKIKLFYR